MTRILNTIGDVYTEDAKRILAELGDVDYKTPAQDELGEIIGGYDAAVIGLGLMFDATILGNAKNLKVIATATTGLDHIDADAAKSRGVEIVSLRGENEFLNTITGTSELAAGLMIDLLRFTPWAFDDVKEYRWERERFRGHNLYGLTLGIVGMGRLGKWMARYGLAFGMRVLYADPNVAESPVAGCERASFDGLLKESDIVSIHVHLSPETEHMFGGTAFAKMKKSAYLINTARGGIVDEDALLQALAAGTIAGYAADVLADENSFSARGENGGFANQPLVEYAKTHRNCIIVPHIGGMTVESRERTDIFIAEKLRAFLKR